MMGKRKRQKLDAGDHGSLFPVPDQLDPQRQQQRRQKQKKRPWQRPKYWVEDCRETCTRTGTVSEEPTVPLTVLITRVQLTDNHAFHRHSLDDRNSAKTGDGTTAQLAPQLGTGATTTTTTTCSSTTKASNTSSNMDVAIPAQEVTVESFHAPAQIQMQATIEDLQLGKDKPTNITKECKSSTNAHGTNLKDQVKSNTVVTADAQRAFSTATGTNSDVEKAIQNISASKKVITSGTTNICIRRDPSAKTTTTSISTGKHHQTNLKNQLLFRTLPNGDCGDGICNPYPKHVVSDKYWAQRYRLFSKFDDGIQLDPESWYSVTPEAIASHIAAKATTPITTTTTRVTKKSFLFYDTTTTNNNNNNDNGIIILDAFCGAGGNAIAFAKQPNVARVLCIDLDINKLKLAAHNARIYNINQEKLLFIHANAFHVMDQYYNGKLKKDTERNKNIININNNDNTMEGYPFGDMNQLPEKLDKIFLSPPWGGMEYEHIGPQRFDLKCIHFSDDTGKNRNGEDMLQAAIYALPSSHDNNNNDINDYNNKIVMFLPRNTNGYQVGKSVLKITQNDGNNAIPDAPTSDQCIYSMMEVEQNILNAKFKAITIYISQ